MIFAGPIELPAEDLVAIRNGLLVFAFIVVVSLVILICWITQRRR